MSFARKRIRELLIPPVPEPNWNIWIKVQSAPLWEAIALSCNIEPVVLNGWQTNHSRIRPPEDFLLRNRLAESDAINGRLSVSIPKGCDERFVAFSDLRKWCEIHGISLPIRFPEAESIEERNRKIFKRYVEHGEQWGAYTQLAKEFGISRQGISKIIQRFQKTNGN